MESERHKHVLWDETEMQDAIFDNMFFNSFLPLKIVKDVFHLRATIHYFRKCNNVAKIIVK